jgi:putative ABC transport system permease protein
MRAQVLAIAVVMMVGVSALIMPATNLHTLQQAQRLFYSKQHFADIFLELTRAPDSLLSRLNAIEGIDRSQTRLRAAARLRLPDYAEPIRGELLSLPDGAQPLLNRLHLRAGRLPSRAALDEVVLGAAFAERHELHPGATLEAVLNGRWQRLTVVGIALSPEFIYHVSPGEILPDAGNFAVLWMGRSAMQQAFDMKGAFNSFSATLQNAADERAVLAAVDRITRRFGGQGAYARDEQFSHRVLAQEVEELRIMRWVLPSIFMGVSAFLLSVLIARVLRRQRQNIAVLKAFGYSDIKLIAHFAGFALLITGLGVGLGVGLGGWAAHKVGAVYLDYFRFPALPVQVQPIDLMLAVLISLASAAIGCLYVLRRVLALAPAEAMRPPVPESYSGVLAKRSGWLASLPVASRMLLRHLIRHPLKSAFSTLGVALSAALMVVGGFQFDAVNQLVDQQYRQIERADLNVYFVQPTQQSVLHELRRLPGVSVVEGVRTLPVTLRNGARSYRTTLQGLPARPELYGLLGQDGELTQLPAEGLVMTDHLAAYLQLRPGDRVQVDQLTEKRETFEVLLVDVVAEPVGVSAYMEMSALHRMLGEQGSLTAARLMVEEDAQQRLYEQLWPLRQVAGVQALGESRRQIRAYLSDTLLLTMGVLLALAGSITFAVVYNNARIAYAERERELATLRVLGYGRLSVAWMLLGEALLLALLALPVGAGLGTGLAWLLNQSIAQDLFRLPFVVSASTYALAVLGVAASMAVSSYLVGRRLWQMDLSSALKSVE